MNNRLMIVALGLIFLAAGCNQEPPSSTRPAVEQKEQAKDQTVDFSEVNATYKFSGKIPSAWQVEYVPATQAINIYDPTIEAASNLEKSQIFIRNFTANDFLTLTTVDILSREETKVNNHPAVRYEIKKKAGVPNFPSQPAWRSGQHRLIDVRLSTKNPSIFYVFSYNPDLDQAVFDDFIQSLGFGAAD